MTANARRRIADLRARVLALPPRRGDGDGGDLHRLTFAELDRMHDLLGGFGPPRGPATWTAAERAEYDALCDKARDESRPVPP